MSRGAPDFLGSESLNVTGSVLDTGEGAARLGSPYVLTRTGRVLWLSGFGGALVPVQTPAIQPGVVVTLSNTLFLHGDQSLLFTVDPQVASGGQVFKDVPYAGLSSYGFEVLFNSQADATSFDFFLDLFTGSQRYRVALRADFDNDRIDLLTSSGQFEPLASNVGFIRGSSGWMSAKVAFDLNAERYTQAIFNGVAYDASSVVFTPDANPEPPVVTVSFAWTGATDNPSLVYVDSMVYTVDDVRAPAE